MPRWLFTVCPISELIWKTKLSASATKFKIRIDFQNSSYRLSCPFYAAGEWLRLHFLRTKEIQTFFVCICYNQKNPRVRKICARNSGAGNGCANFTGAWKNCVLSAGNPMPIEFLVLGGMGLGFEGAEKRRFYFYGRGNFSDITWIFSWEYFWSDAFFAYNWKLPAYNWASLLTIVFGSFWLAIGVCWLTIEVGLLEVGKCV